MNNRSKNKIRNASNSRQSRSNLPSNSKQKPSIGKNKSDKNLFLKPKHPSLNPHSKNKQHSKNSSRSAYQNLPDSRPNKIPKKQLPSEEYYNHAKKTKSKTKIQQQTHEQIQKQKKSYFESLYMHKEDEPDLPEVLENSFENPRDRLQSPLNTNMKMIKKIRMIEKHAAIDANGKFVQKQPKKTDRKLQSQQHTFSVFQNTKQSIAGNTQLQTKKSSHNLKMKKDKLKLKTKNSQLYQAEMITQNKSSMKSVIKLKKYTSSGKDTKDIRQVKQEMNLSRNPDPQEIYKFRSTRQATRITTQRQTIQTSSNKTIQSADTESSPQFVVKNNFISCLSDALVSYDQVIKEIEQEKQNLKILRATITNNQYLQERIKAIDFIGKICHLMSVKRQAHAVAVIFLDSYVQHIISSVMKDKEKRKLFKLNEDDINFPELIKNLKLFAITCLLLALKMDDGLMARKLCFQLNTNLEGLLKSSQSKINQKMKESIAHLHGFTSTSTTKESRKQSVYSLSKSKTNISSMSSVKNLQEKESRKAGKKQKDEYSNNTQNIDMNSIIRVETDILLKFKFKLTVKSPQYWIDMFTFLWDEYINTQVSWEEMLYFRQHDSTANISHLMQILQKTYLNLQVYQFPTFTIVLAIMYLIIRVKLEEQKECENLKTLFEKYRNNLLKSTNIIFYDNIGINELYGDFLTQLNLSLSDIVTAVKYVAQFFVYEHLKSFSFNNKSKQVNNRYDLHEHRISLYQYNAQVYASALK